MRILLIAPDQVDISWAVEAEQIGRLHQIAPLLGRVTHERITRATTGQRFDVVHVATHGDDDGVLLSDGEVMNKEQLCQVVRHVRSDLVFLNACRSAALAQFLIDGGALGAPAIVLAWTKPVLDADGLRTASYFYDELAHDSDLRVAYNKVNPRDGTLLFLAGPGYIDDLIRPLRETIQQMAEQIAQLSKRLLNSQQLQVRVVAGAVALMLLINAGAVWLVAGAHRAQAQGVPSGPAAETPTGEPPTPAPAPPTAIATAGASATETVQATPVETPTPLPVLPSPTSTSSLPTETTAVAPIEPPTVVVPPTGTPPTGTPPTGTPHPSPVIEDEEEGEAGMIVATLVPWPGTPGAPAAGPPVPTLAETFTPTLILMPTPTLTSTTPGTPTGPALPPCVP